MTMCIDLVWDEAEPVRETCVTSIIAAFHSVSFGVHRERSKNKVSAAANDDAPLNSLARTTGRVVVDAGYTPPQDYLELLFGDEIAEPSTRLKAS
jgi:hypothetical protein